MVKSERKNSCGLHSVGPGTPKLLLTANLTDLFTRPRSLKYQAFSFLLNALARVKNVFRYLEAQGDSLVKPCNFPLATCKSPLLVGGEGRAHMQSSRRVLHGLERQVFTTWLLKSLLPCAK